MSLIFFDTHKVFCSCLISIVSAESTIFIAVGCTNAKNPAQLIEAHFLRRTLSGPASEVVCDRIKPISATLTTVLPLSR